MFENKEESFNSEELNENRSSEKKLVEPDPSPNITWGKEVEDVLLAIAERSKRYAKINIDASIRRTRIYNTIMYLLMITGSLTGILASVTDTKGTQIAVISLAFISGVLSSVVKFSKFSQKASKYGSIGTRFQALAENIDRQLKLSVKDRVSSQSYLKWITASYDTLFVNMPAKTNIEDTPIKEDVFSDSRMEFELARLHAV